MIGLGKYDRHSYRTEFLSSPTWKFFREQYLGTNKHCHKCFKRRPLDIHHCRYNVEMDKAPFFILALCRECHKGVEKGKRLGLLRKEHNPDEALLLKPSRLKSMKVPIRDAWLKMINQATSQEQRIACGVLKILPPSDWMHISGVKFPLSAVRRLEEMFVENPVTPDVLLTAIDLHKEIKQRLVKVISKEKRINGDYTPEEMERAQKFSESFYFCVAWVIYMMNLAGRDYLSLSLHDLRKLGKSKN